MDVSTQVISLLNGEAIEAIPPVREVICKVVFLDIEKLKNDVPMTEEDWLKMNSTIWRKTSWQSREGLVTYIEENEKNLVLIERKEMTSAYLPSIHRESIEKCKDELSKIDSQVANLINSYPEQLVQKARVYVEDIREKKGYDYVLPVSQTVYADERFDITTDVVAILKDKFSPSTAYQGGAASNIAFLSIPEIQNKCTLTANGAALSKEQLMPKIKTVLRELQKSKGFDAVIHEGLFSFANSSLDVSSDVIALLNTGKY
jgi:Skp family chaperone for outer membrane proteins